MASGTVSTPVSTVPLWINGAPADAHSARRGDVCNPSTGEVIRTVPLGDAQDVDRAVAAAAAAFPAWSATPPVRRVRILARFLELLAAHQKELALLVSEEHGKVFLDAMGSVQRGIEVVEFACGAPHLL
jgi:malonate-semialdehyde dehydrogenase (acetylating)/methylmalonate-semialdehyde dehydrogenase